MTDKFVIQVDFFDLIGSKITQRKGSRYNINVGQLIFEVLDEEIGGLLCIEHFHIPQVEAPREESFFQVEIHCCCNFQKIAVRRRLAEIFKG